MWIPHESTDVKLTSSVSLTSLTSITFPDSRKFLTSQKQAATPSCPALAGNKKQAADMRVEDTASQPPDALHDASAFALPEKGALLLLACAALIHHIVPPPVTRHSPSHA